MANVKGGKDEPSRFVIPGGPFDLDFPSQLGEILSYLCVLAISDHAQGARVRTGEELVDLLPPGSNSRNGHTKAMTMAYRTARWSIEVRERERTEGNDSRKLHTL